MTFERLEDRTLLAVFTVTNLNDAGAGSLRAAVAAAEGNAGADEIVFQADLAGAINLTSGQMAITQDLTITGNGQEQSIIDAGQNSRHFLVAGSGVDLTLAGLTLRNGRTTGDADDGGSIRFNGFSGATLTILNSTLRNNSTTGSTADGGAINMSFSSSRLTVANSTLSGNFTTGTSSAQGGRS